MIFSSHLLTNSMILSDVRVLEHRWLRSTPFLRTCAHSKASLADFTSRPLFQVRLPRTAWKTSPVPVRLWISTSPGRGAWLRTFARLSSRAPPEALSLISRENYAHVSGARCQSPGFLRLSETLLPVLIASEKFIELNRRYDAENIYSKMLTLVELSVRLSTMYPSVNLNFEKSHAHTALKRGSGESSFH